MACISRDFHGSGVANAENRTRKTSDAADSSVTSKSDNEIMHIRQPFSLQIIIMRKSNNTEIIKQSLLETQLSKYVFHLHL